MLFRVGLIGAFAMAVFVLPACDQKSEAETSGERSGRAAKRVAKDDGSASDAKANMSKAKTDAKKIATKAAAPAKKKSGKAVVELTVYAFCLCVVAFFCVYGFTLIEFQEMMCLPEHGALA